MQSNQEKFERWLDAYLDDALNAKQRATFEALLEKDPAARKAVELQRAMDDSLKRVFQPPAKNRESSSGENGRGAHEYTGDAEQLADKTDEVARPARKINQWRRVALAAMVTIVAGGGAWWWLNSSGAGDGRVDPTLQYPTFLAFYQASARNDFKEDWVCASPSEFAATFATRVGHGLKQPATAAGVELLGLKYGRTITGLTVHIMAKVDGEGVIVFVDKKSRDPSPASKQGDLNVFRRELEHLIVFEMTPHDKASILPSLEEQDVSAEDVQKFYRRQGRPSRP